MFNKKKKYFKKKLDAVVCMTWDLEFKREKTLQMREDLRREYDGACAKLQVIETQLAALPEDKTKWTDEQKRLEDQKTLLVRDIEGVKNGDGTVARAGYKDSLRDLDLEVHGSKKTNEFPDGLNGMDQQIEGLVSLQGHLKQFIKTL